MGKYKRRSLKDKISRDINQRNEILINKNKKKREKVRQAESCSG